MRTSRILLFCFLLVILPFPAVESSIRHGMRKRVLLRGDAPLEVATEESKNGEGRVLLGLSGLRRLCLIRGGSRRTSTNNLASTGNNKNRTDKKKDDRKNKRGKKRKEKKRKVMNETDPNSRGEKKTKTEERRQRNANDSDNEGNGRKSSHVTFEEGNSSRKVIFISFFSYSYK